MSEERFIVPKEKDDEFYWNIIDTENGKVVLQHISRFATSDMCFLLNRLDYECSFLLEQREHLKENCKQLEQQYFNLVNAIVKTCNDLNNTEEVYLGDFDICKRITEYEKELSDDDKEQIFNCNNCKYHKDEKRDDLEHFSYPYSYCERKRCRLGSRERNWEGSWEQCKYTCFVPNEQTKRYIHNSY